MSGFDPEAIAEAIAEALSAVPAIADRLTIEAFPSEAPWAPFVGVFPEVNFFDYHEGGSYGPENVGDMQFVLKALAKYGAEDSFRLLYQLAATGADHDLSLADAIEADRTLGGVVQDCVTTYCRIRSYGEPNDPSFELAIGLYVIVKREAP